MNRRNFFKGIAALPLAVLAPKALPAQKEFFVPARFGTDVVTVRSGYESRNAEWKELKAFFEATRGREHSFRFKGVR